MSANKKVVLVTGCTKGGIGYALCEEYATQGCIVYATARKPESMGSFAHPDIHMLQLDVTSDEGVANVVDTIIKEQSRIDIVVNNAGANVAGALLDVPLDTLRSTYEINTFSILRVTKAVFPHMAARKSGEIINLGSIGGDIPTPWNGAYSSSKAAVRGISDVLWQELKPFGISVTHISAGAVRSNIAQKAIDNGVVMPEGSLYKPYEDCIVQRVWASQGANSLPAGEFSKKVVTASLAPRPPRWMTLGGMSFLFYVFSWLPRTWVLNKLWQRYLVYKRK